MNIKKIRMGSFCLAAMLIFAVQLARARHPTLSGSGSKMDAADGKTVFMEKCEPCHFDLSDKKKIGPGLAGLMRQERFKNGMPADDYHLKRVIERGGKDMPAFRGALSEKQIRDLIVYLKSL